LNDKKNPLILIKSFNPDSDKCTAGRYDSLGFFIDSPDSFISNMILLDKMKKSMVKTYKENFDERRVCNDTEK
jgi:hypothetical protein